MAAASDATAPDADTVFIWRHPRAQGAEGRCIGRTDLAVDRREAKRLAHRIRAFAQRYGLPREVVTSPLRRCADVGRVLAAWGWQHHIDPALVEVDFGAWDGCAWASIPRAEVDEWCADLAHYRPGGGESVDQLLARVAAWRPGTARVAVGHGGWLSAAMWMARPGASLTVPRIDAADWPAAPGHGHCTPLHGAQPRSLAGAAAAVALGVTTTRGRSRRDPPRSDRRR